MKRIFTQRQLSTFKNFKKNVLSKDSVVKILDKRNEQREFYEALKEHKKGGINTKEMREIIGSFHYKSNDHIDKKETRGLAREYIRGSRNMIRPAKERLLNRRSVEQRVNRVDNIYGASNNFQPSNKLSATIKPRLSGSGGIKLVC